MKKLNTKLPYRQVVGPDGKLQMFKKGKRVEKLDRPTPGEEGITAAKRDAHKAKGCCKEAISAVLKDDVVSLSETVDNIIRGKIEEALDAGYLKKCAADHEDQSIDYSYEALKAAQKDAEAYGRRDSKASRDAGDERWHKQECARKHADIASMARDLIWKLQSKKNRQEMDSSEKSDTNSPVPYTY